MPEVINSHWIIVISCICFLIIWLMDAMHKKIVKNHDLYHTSFEYHLSTILSLYSSHMKNRYGYTERDLKEIVMKYYGNIDERYINYVLKFIDKVNEINKRMEEKQ